MMVFDWEWSLKRTFETSDFIQATDICVATNHLIKVKLGL